MAKGLIKNGYLNRETTQRLKGVAILLVIIGHLTGLKYIPLPDFFKYAGAWGVAMFLMMSGFGLTQSYLSNGLEDFFQKRVATVILPYTLVTMIWILIDTDILGKRYSLLVTLSSLIGLNPRATIDPTMWYITFLLFWYGAFYCSFRFIKSFKGRILALLLFALVLYKFSWAFNGGGGASLYVLEFPLGVALGLFYSKIRDVHRWKLIVIGALSFLVFVLAINKLPQALSWYVLANIAFAAGCMAAFSVVGMGFGILKNLGDMSYYLYLVEGAFLDKYHVLKLTQINVLNLAIYFLVIITSSKGLMGLITLLNSRCNTTTILRG